MPSVVATTTISPSQTQASFRITIPEDLLHEYEAQASVRGVQVEDLIAERLGGCVEHRASKPLYFDDRQRQQLEQVLGRNVLNSTDALLQIRNAMSVRIGKVMISLKLNLMQKLRSRCIGTDWDTFLQKLITDELERYVGLR